MAKATTCPRCRSTFPEKARFCASCGLSLAEHEVHVLQRRGLVERRRKGVELRILFIVVFVLMLAGYLLAR